ncbi:MAG: pyruvate kinase alpha/beta domain-containing protein [Lachnospiraceae bacterium]
MMNNTEACVELAINTARERNLKHIVVASSSGSTAGLFRGHPELNVACVSLAYGYGKDGGTTMTVDAMNELTHDGIRVLNTTHVLSGAERGISKKHGGISPVEIMADTLRMFGQGTKVCVEVSIMALDAGLIPYGEEIIAVAGSGHGADTVLIIRPEHASNILDTKIIEIICKPRF